MTATEFLAAIQAAVTEAGEEMTLAQFQAAVSAAAVLPDDDTLTDWYNAIVTAVASAPTIKTVKIGYLHELANGQTDYDILLITPMTYEVASPRSWSMKEFIPLTYYIIRQNVGATGDLMTDTERVAAWSALDVVNKTIIEKLQESPTTFQINGSVTVDYNSGGPAQLLPDNVVWIEVKFKCRISDC